MRWRLVIDEYDFKIEHRSGTQNRVADALSREVVGENSREINVMTRSQAMKQGESTENIILLDPNHADPSSDISHQPGMSINTDNHNTNSSSISFSTLKNDKSNPNLPTSSNPLLNHSSSSKSLLKPNLNSNISDFIPIPDTTSNSFPNQNSSIQLPNSKSSNSLPSPESSSIFKLTDEDQINQVIKEFHLTPTGGHQGVYRTNKRIKSIYYFPKMFSKIDLFIKNCPKFQVNKYSIPSRLPMKITTTSHKPFEKIFLDIVGPFLSSHQYNKYILTIQDDLTKYSFAAPVPNQEAEIIAKAFVESFVCVHGTPSSILTDQGTNFLSKFFESVSKLLQIRRFTSYIFIIQFR